MRSCSIPLMVALAALALAGSARAGGLVLTAADFDAQPGATGSFLVTLTNTDATDATLTDYQIQMTTDVVGLSFTGVAKPMLPDPAYVFPGPSEGPTSSDFGPPFPGSPVTTFTAVDFSATFIGYDTLAAGRTYGVMRVSYSVDPTAPLGMGHVSFVSPGALDTDLTQLTDAAGSLITFSAIDGIASVVPEPSGMVLMVCGLTLLAAGRGVVGRAGRRTPRVIASREQRVSDLHNITT